MTVTKLEDFQFKAIDAVNKIVECDEESFDERHRVIERVRKHLESRADQCKPQDTIAFEDLMGGWTQ